MQNYIEHFQTFLNIVATVVFFIWAVSSILDKVYGVLVKKGVNTRTKHIKAAGECFMAKFGDVLRDSENLDEFLENAQRIFAPNLKKENNSSTNTQPDSIVNPQNGIYQNEKLFLPHVFEFHGNFDPKAEYDRFVVYEKAVREKFMAAYQAKIQDEEKKRREIAEATLKMKQNTNQGN